MLWQLAATEMRQRPGRAVLTLLSIVIGVAAVVAVQLTASTTHRAYEEMSRRLNGRAALEIVHEGGSRFQASLVEGVNDIPGIAAAVPSLQAHTVLLHPNGHVQLRLLGIDPLLDPQVRDYEVTEGTFFQDGRGILLEEEFARWAGIAVSDELRLLIPQRRGFVRKEPVVGLLASRGVAGFNQGGVLFFSLAQAQRLFARPGQIDTVSLVLTDAADKAAVREAVAQHLPAGLIVRPTATEARLGSEVFRNAERGLEFACALMIALAIFIVLNTFQMNLSERRAQLAILRAVGATRRQILQMLLSETLAMGVVGAVFGCLLGLAGARLLLRAMAQLSGSPPFPLQLTYMPFVLAVALGIGVAVLATYLPAQHASRISPMEAMRVASPNDGHTASRLTTVGGAALFVASGVVVSLCIRGWLPIVVSIPAGVTFLAAFALVIPALVRPLGRCVLVLLSPLLHVEGDLAEQQLAHRSARAGLTAGVLYIAIAAGVGLGTTIINNVRDVRNWNRRTMEGDFLVCAAFGDATTGEGVQMPEAIGSEIRKLDGVVNVDTIRYFQVSTGSDRVTVLGRDYARCEQLPLVLAVGEPEEVKQRFAAGEAVLGTVLAERRGLKVGDSIELETPDGPRSLRIAGLAVDYTVGGNVVFIERTEAERTFHVSGADMFLIRALPKALDQVHEQLAALCEKEHLMVYSFAELSRLLDGIMGGILSGLWGLLALGYVVAGFGIGNTLMMNVAEQTREIALLRVVGMTQRQVRKMILAQAAIIGVVGLSLGVFAGVNTAYIMSLCMQPLLGYTIAFSLPPMLILGSFGMAMLIVFVAAWFPAQRATKLDLLIALPVRITVTMARPDALPCGGLEYSGVRHDRVQNAAACPPP